MKTIFITMTRGGTARNILQNEFYNLIKKKFDKVIVLSTATHDDRFLNEFKDDDVEFVSVIDVEQGIWEYVFLKLYVFLVWTSTTTKLILYDAVSPKFKLSQYIKCALFKIIFYPLSKLIVIRKLLRLLDFFFLQKKTTNKYRDIIKKYKPSLIFCTSISEETEAALLKAAKKENIFTIAMPKTWDNPSKKYFQAKADKIVVWGPFMTRQMQKLQDYKKEDIEVVGVPQFDYYIDNTRIVPREDFCQKTGLNPNKKIILFGSEGKVIPTEPIMVQILLDFIKNYDLVEDCQILVRPHFGYKKDFLKFRKFFNRQNEGIVVDLFNNPSTNFRDEWDYSVNQMNHFLNIIYHSSMVINTCSTLTLDAAALNKPAILIKFDGYEKLPFYKSAARWYISDYYNKILEFGAAIEVNNTKEFKNAINTLLKNPDIHIEERQKLLNYFCYKIDGNSGKRLYEAIINNHE